MMKNPSHKKIPASKPFIKFRYYINPENNATFRKKAPKYVQKIEIQEKAQLVRRIKICKILRSITLNVRDYEQLPYDLGCFLYNQIALKTFKPFHKYLKSYYSIYDRSSKIERPLQNLSVAKIHPDDSPHNLKSILRMINFEKIIFQFEANYYSRTYDREVEVFLNFLSQMRHRLVRHLQQLRKIREIEIHVKSYSFKILAALLEILKQNPLLIPSLKNLKIIAQKISPLSTLEILPAESSQIQSILPYITFLQIWHQKWISTPIIFNNFRNIQELRINCKFQDLNKCYFKTQFPALKNLTKLRSFNLEFTSFSRKIEKAFIESFTLPISIERVKLILAGFKWKTGELTKENKEFVEKSFKEHPRYINFFNQWKKLPTLKELGLIMEESDQERDSSSVCASFAINIFKQVKTLTQVAFLNTASQTKTAIKAVEFKDIWESLMPSKETLEFVKIRTPQVDFASSINSLETNLPKLEFFSLLGTVYWASEIFDFGRALLQHQKKEKNGLKFSVSRMVFNELKELQLFFNNLQTNIPTCLEGRIELDMKELKGEIWVDDFCEFMQTFKTGEKIRFTLFNVSITSYKAVQRVKSVVANNRAFSSFDMRCILNYICYFNIPKEGNEDEDEWEEIQDLVDHGFVKIDS